MVPAGRRPGHVPLAGRSVGAVVRGLRPRERIALYRGYLHLIMWIEAVPRKNDDKCLAWLHGCAFEPLARTLDRWASRA